METLLAKDTPEGQAFLIDLEALYIKHGLALSHEDGHGAFIITNLSPLLVKWVREAWLERIA